jgi:multidrug efflux pump subunit AcrA (membrane-fusion protein)
VNANKRAKKSKQWLWLVVVVVLALAGGGGYYYWTLQQAAGAAAANTSTAAQTSQVRQGSISISATGSGTLTAAQERSLSFSTSGTVASLNVQVGDVVKQGDELAQLADLADLQGDVSDATQALQDAQAALVDLQASAASNLADAQLAVSDAQQALLDAQDGLLNSNMTRCDADTIEAQYFQWQNAQKALTAAGDGGGASDYYLSVIVPAKNAVASAKAAYDYCAGFFEYEISASQANLALAQAKVDDAQATLAELTANNGIDPLALHAAENTVSAAKLALSQAEEKLAGGTLTAPFDGTVLSVAGAVGDSVGTSAFITLADLAHPRITFSMDETDLDKVFIGESATISFDAVADRTFKGTVLRVDPALTTSGGYAVLTGVIELDLSQEKDMPTLPKGINATIELLAASADQALLVPVQALQTQADGTYSVTVIDTSGQTHTQVVEVGIQDAASVEIKSGLKLGDVVSTNQ